MSQPDKVINRKNSRQLLIEARLHQVRLILGTSKDGHLTKRKRYQIAKLLMSLPSPMLKFAVQYLRTIQTNQNKR
jgi:hypothetical protein